MLIGVNGGPSNV